MISISHNTQSSRKDSVAVGEAHALRGEAPGFIYYSTSVPDSNTKASSEPFVINPREARLKNLKKGVINGARLHQNELIASGDLSRYQAVFLTCTYADGVDWEPYHITRLIKQIRKWCDRKGIKFRYVWVAEIQESRKRKFGDGAGHCVHYHVMLWIPKCYQLPKPDKQGWWPHGHTKTERARNSVGYLAKYASKGTNFDFPPGCRLHACGGLGLISRLERTWWALPSSIRRLYPDFADIVRRAKGGGWNVRLTGEWFPALFKVTCFNPLTVVRVAEVLV